MFPPYRSALLAATGAGFLLLPLAVPAAVCNRPVRMPSGSYLRAPAAGPGDLRTAVLADPIVRSRYTRLFRVGSDDVADSFANLTVGRLAVDGVYRVYFVHAGEILGYKVRRVRRGTPVFMMHGSVPLLIQACGNPLRPSLERTGISRSDRTVPVPDFSPYEPDRGASAVPAAFATASGRPDQRHALRTSDFIPDPDQSPFQTETPPNPFAAPHAPFSRWVDEPQKPPKGGPTGTGPGTPGTGASPSGGSGGGGNGPGNTSGGSGGGGNGPDNPPGGPGGGGNGPDNPPGGPGGGDTNPPSGGGGPPEGGPGGGSSTPPVLPPSGSDTTSTPEPGPVRTLLACAAACVVLTAARRAASFRRSIR